MAALPEYLTPELWLDQVFNSAEARRGGIVKRQVRDVERLVGRAVFVRELNRRGFRALQNGRHYVIFCNQHPLLVVR
jgi:hypothetical protein